MRLCSKHIVLAALILGSVSSPAFAGFDAQTRLVKCGQQDCLQISGQRAGPAHTISLNGRETPAEGERKWRVVLTLETVRRMSASGANVIEVSVRDPKTLIEHTVNASLPIGLLGDISGLDAIRVAAL